MQLYRVGEKSDNVDDPLLQCAAYFCVYFYVLCSESCSLVGRDAIGARPGIEERHRDFTRLFKASKRICLLALHIASEAQSHRTSTH